MELSAQMFEAVFRQQVLLPHGRGLRHCCCCNDQFGADCTAYFLCTKEILTFGYAVGMPTALIPVPCCAQ